MKHMVTVSVAIALALAASPAFAAKKVKLPKSAKPMAAEEITKLYVGNTITYDTKWGKANYTWTADGKVLGIMDKKDGKKAWADGKWTLNGNEFCFSVVWRDTKAGKGSDYSPCKAWYTVGKAIWSKNTTGNGEWDGAVSDADYKDFVKGDNVSGRMDPVMATLN